MIPACQSAPASEWPFLITEDQVRGLGQTVAQKAATTGSIIAAGATTGAMIAGPFGAAIGAGIAAAGAGLLLLFTRKGPGQKVKAAKLADEAEIYLQQNLAAYMSGDHTAANRQAALANFDFAWRQLQLAVQEQKQEFGEPGTRIIPERSRGGRWDWAGYYRDPIADDPDVKPDITTLLPEALGGTGSSFAPLLAVGLLLWGLLA